MSYRRSRSTVGSDLNGNEFSSHFASPSGIPTHYSPHQPLPSMYSQRAPEALETKLDEIMGMISNTQQMLMEQVTATKKLEKAVDDMNTEIKDVQRELDEVKKYDSASKGATSKRCKLPTQLSATIRKLHENAAEDTKFDGKEMYSSAQNEKVKEFLLKELQEQYTGKYTSDCMKRGIYRYYESRRRIVNDQKPHRLSKVAENKKNAQKAAFQKRLYERRQKSIKNEDERKKWSSISLKYMTEESESDEDRVRQHKLPWRSDELNKLVKSLDKRGKKADAGTGRFTTKNRILSTDSTSNPPLNSPPWSIKVVPISSGSSNTNVSANTVVTPTRNAINTTPSGPPSTSGMHRRRTLITATQQIFDDSSDSSSSEEEM